MNANTLPPSTSQCDSLPLLSLTEAAHLVSGNPSASAVWRWCRRGVLARDGTRIRLEHRRVGGKIFTSSNWLDDFTRALTAADTAYFASKQAAADGALDRVTQVASTKRPLNPRRSRPVTDPYEQQIAGDELQAALQAEGL